MDSMVHEDDGLWDELDNQQSREIQQHRARTTPSAARQLANQTANEVGRVAAVFYQAAADAWEEQKHRQQQQQQPYHHHHHHHDDEEGTSFLQDFGLPAEEQQALQMEPIIPGEQRNNDDGGFVFLPNFRFRPQAEGWGAVANLDLYFSSLYSYFYHRGLVPIVGKGVVELVTMVFTLVLSVFLFMYVDWPALASCKDEASCRPTLGAYLIHKPFTRWSIWTFLVVIYCLIFLAYTAFAALSFLRTAEDAMQAKWVFEERLGISARRLEGGAVDWDKDVVCKLLELQQSGEYRVAIHGQDLDALVIAQRILRRENFLVALFNRGLLDLSVPLIGNQMFCPSLEWSLYFCILNFMFNHKYQIRPAFYLDPSALRRRLILCGIGHLIFMPFLLFFLTLYFGLQNAYDWKNTQQYLGPKDWSMAAKWTFREFNELQHHFERRIAPAYEATEDYLKLFGQSEIIAALGRILVFIGGSLGAVLFAFAAMNDAILLHVKVADWNLLWYAGVVGALYSGGKAMIPNAEAQPRSSRNLFAEIDEALGKVASHTHHYPNIWKGRGWDPSTHKAISSMFKFKAQNFALEVLSLIVAPYILCVSLAKCAEPICEFVLAIRAEVAGAGDVCGYATFDFELYGDEKWDGRTMGNHHDPLSGTLTESIMQTGNVKEAVKAHPKPKCKHGKMEQSFFSFRDSHPSWKCSASGQHLVDQAEQQREQSAALKKEQELHIKAATRQLDTLAELERTPTTEPNGLDAQVNNTYIQTTQQALGPDRDGRRADGTNGHGTNTSFRSMQQPLPSVADEGAFRRT